MAQPKILLADDDEELCQLLRDFLTREGFVLELAHDGKLALELCRKNSYDALILDAMLPERSGFDLLRELRRESHMPVLMLTALGEDIDKILGLELGADDYVPKPCNPREIAARLRAILRRTRVLANDEQQRVADLRIGPIHLQSSSRSVSVNGKPVAMTGTEFNILAILMREAGRVVSKDILSQNVLGHALGPYDRSIDVHMSNIRRKIGQILDGELLIATVPRNGYLFRLTEPVDQ